MAAGFTSEESSLAHYRDFQAPLTISANGQWRVHVDAKNQLIRTSLADPKTENRTLVPDGVRSLSASRTAQKVAFTLSAEINLVIRSQQ